LKTKTKYFFFLLLSFRLHSQSFERPLQNAGCRLFSGSIYVYGLTGDKNTSFTVYKTGRDLKVSDSITVNLGKYPVAEFLQLSSDTLHDFLNIYIQRREKKMVQLFRFNAAFKLVASVENIDIARLNSISAFQNEIYYYKKNVFSVKISNSDTAGKQFFLDKYSYKSDQKNFEYEMKWQFPFERKNVHSAHLISIDNKCVLLYVNVSEGPKTGQWILKIDQQKGTLIKGSKIGNKGDASFYSFGALLNDTTTAVTYILGQKFNSSDFNQKDNKLTIAGKPFITAYLAQLDTSLELLSRDEFKVPVSEPKGNKTPNAYILKPSPLKKTQDGNLIFKTDIYKGSNLGCYHYCNTLSNTITSVDEKLVLDKGIVTTNTVLESYYLNPDKADMNGKICCDSITDFEKIYYKHIPLEVKVDFKNDEAGNPVWLLKKSDAKKAVELFSVVKPEKKILQTFKIEEINKSENPQVFTTSPSQFIISRQLTGEKFQVKLFTW
jgi:hypothetical protein